MTDPSNKDAESARDWSKVLVDWDEVLHPDPRIENELLVARMIRRQLRRSRLRREAEAYKQAPGVRGKYRHRYGTESYNAHLNRIHVLMQKRPVKRR